MMKSAVALSLVVALASASTMVNDIVSQINKPNPALNPFGFDATLNGGQGTPQFPPTYEYILDTTAYDPETGKPALKFQMHTAGDHKQGFFFTAAHDMPEGMGFKNIVRFPDSIQYSVQYIDDYCWRLPIYGDVPSPPSLPEDDTTLLGQAECVLPDGERAECDVWVWEIEGVAEYYYYFHAGPNGDMLVFLEAFATDYLNPVVSARTVMWTEDPDEDLWEDYRFECDVPPTPEQMPTSYAAAVDRYLACNAEELCHVFEGVRGTDGRAGHFTLSGVYKMPYEEEWNDTWNLYRGDEEKSYTYVGGTTCTSVDHHRDAPAPYTFHDGSKFLEFVECDSTFGLCEVWHVPEAGGEYHSRLLFDNWERVPVEETRYDGDGNPKSRAEYFDWILEVPSPDWFEVREECLE